VTRTGGAIPLHQVCAVRLLASEGDAEATLVRSRAESATATLAAITEGMVDVAGSDDEEEGGGAAAGGAAAGGAAAAAGKKEGGAASAAAPAAPAGPFGNPVVTRSLIGIDLGATVLVIDAAETKTRNAWVAAIRKYSDFHKRHVDEEMFKRMGGQDF
jgi:hypothetical protein